MTTLTMRLVKGDLIAPGGKRKPPASGAPSRLGKNIAPEARAESGPREGGGGGSQPPPSKIGKLTAQRGVAHWLHRARPQKKPRDAH